MTSRIMIRTAWGLFALTVVQLVGVAVLAVLTRAVPDPGRSHPWLLNLVNTLVVTAALAIVGLLLATRRPANPIGWLLTGVALVWSTNDFTHQYARYAVEYAPGSLPAGLATGWFASWNYALAFPLIPLLFLLFPDGRLPSPRWRLVGWAAVGLGSVILALSPFRTGPLEYFPTIRNPTGLVPPTVVIALGLSFALLGCACATALLVRLRHARGDEHQQLKWVAAAGILLAAEGIVGGFLLPSRIHELLSTLTIVAFAAAIAVAVLKYRLYDIDVFISRSVVYGTLTAGIAALYLFVTALGGVAFSGRAAAPGIAAALAVAVGLAPARVRLQRAVDHLLYGERHDPLRAVTRLGDHVAGAHKPDLLAAVLTGVQQAVNAAGACVVGTDGRRLGAIGVETPDGESLPLRVGGRDLGVLRVSTRGARDTYSDADRHLLTALAPPVAVAVRALELAGALEVEHRRVLTATRAERERVRHELHDGLLSRLFGIRMGLTGVDDALRIGDTGAARAQLATMRTEVRGANEETRRIVAAQRPIALDEWGLVPAIRRHAVAGSGPTVTVTACALPILSPQVEEAAYRIAIEAVTNAARHAGAGRVDVGLAVAADDLVLTVTDDGSGFRVAPEGVGLSSMRSRAASAGGSLDLTTGPVGTTVTATLPLEEP